jgi:hypothetical protein
MASSDEPLVRVQARIEDAGVLADAGRLEGALLMLLVAVAATSRKRYPPATPSKVNAGKKMGDAEAFKTFLRDEMWRLMKGADEIVEFRGASMRIEDFLYKFLRNELAHEGGLPVDLQPIQNDAVLSMLNPNGSGVSFTRLLLARLNDVVWRAPENSYEMARPELDAIAERRANKALQQNRDDVLRS